ncbi:glycine-rich domain-containing protein [Thiomonas sp.]
MPKIRISLSPIRALFGGALLWFALGAGPALAQNFEYRVEIPGGQPCLAGSWSATAPGTYSMSVPAGCASLHVVLNGAGGGGDLYAQYSVGSPGHQVSFDIPNPGTPLSVSVGAGGADVGQATGDPGNPSSISYAAALQGEAAGGAGGGTSTGLGSDMFPVAATSSADNPTGGGAGGVATNGADGSVFVSW